MTGFDYIVLLIVGVAAIGGFLRGFAQEVLSLGAWIFAALAVHYLHTPFSEWLQQYIGNDVTTSLLAFALLLVIPYFSMKLIAKNVGNVSRASMLGPIDRVLGFGFGALKGALVAVFAFSLLALGYDNMWDYRGRPTWMTTARTYEFIDGASRSLVEMLADRRAAVQGSDAVLPETE